MSSRLISQATCYRIFLESNYSVSVMTENSTFSIFPETGNNLKLNSEIPDVCYQKVVVLR